MRVGQSSLLILWLVFAALGCGTGTSSLRGRVLELPSVTAGQLPPERPLAHAGVTAACPDERTPRATTYSDADGFFFVELPRPIPNACALRAERDGYEPASATVLDACAHGEQERCTELTWTARLRAVGAPP
jgi:hypothetical protein